MNIKDFMASLSKEEREQFAAEAGTSVGYLNLLSCGARKPSPDMCKRLVPASKEKLTYTELRPDIYGHLPERRKTTYRRRDRRSASE
jgi:transcriptional regulator with XRE-family HTH domain